MGDPRPSSISIDRTLPAVRRGSPGVNIATPAMNIVPSDGFSSPRDTAHTPPGVVTKIETKFYKTSAVITATRLECANCGKRDACLCKKCTLEKLKFYARKERLAKVQREKTALAEEIERIMGESSSIAVETNASEERIYVLKRKIEEKRRSIREKRDALKFMDKELASHPSKCTTFQAIAKKHEEEFRRKGERSEKKIEMLEENLNDIARMRTAFALQLMNMFPVREVLAVQPPADPTNQSNKWAVVSGHRALDEGNMFQIRDLCLSEASLEKLAAGMTRSPLELPCELRSTFGAFIHTVHLLILISYIVNFRLPHKFDLRELTLYDRWTKNMLDCEWFKLCQCVLGLGLRVGVNSDVLHFHYPHSNLIEIARHIYNGDLTENLSPSGVSGNHCEEIRNASAKIDEREMKDWDMCVDKDDLLDF